MIQLNSDVVFIDASGQVRSLSGDLTLRAGGATREIIVGSGASLRPEEHQVVDLGRTDLRWRNLHATSGTFVERPSVNGSGVLLQGEQGVFGTYFQSASNEGVTVATGIVFQNKLTLTTPSLPTGTYRIGYSYEHRVSRRDRTFEIRVELDGSDTLSTERYLIPSTNPAADDSWQVGGFAHRNLSAGSHTISIDLRKVTNNADFTISIRRARLEIWRVS